MVRDGVELKQEHETALPENIDEMQKTADKSAVNIKEGEFYLPYCC